MRKRIFSWGLHSGAGAVGAILAIAAACSDTTAPAAVGYGLTSTRHAAPTAISASPSLALSSNLGCVLGTSGKVACWGASKLIATGSFLQEPQVPVQPPALTLPYLRFTELQGDPNGPDICGLASDRHLYCWDNADASDARLADSVQALVHLFPNTHCGLAADSTVYCASKSVAAGLHFTFVAEGRDHTCGITAAGALYCFGADIHYHPSAGTVPSPAAPTLIGLGAPVTSVAIGFQSTCATAGGTAYCWGGSDPIVPAGGVGGTPTAVPGSSGLGILYTSGTTACGLDGGGLVYCWGEGGDGAFGAGSTASTFATSPVPAAGGRAFAALTAFGVRWCGLSTDRMVYCWGGPAIAFGPASLRNDPSPVSSPVPVIDLNVTPSMPVDTIVAAPGAITLFPNRVSSVAATPIDTRGVTILGAAVHWSSSDPDVVTIDTTTLDVIGLREGSAVLTASIGGRTTQVSVAVIVPSADFMGIVAGDFHSCVLAKDGTAYCSGSNTVGQLGDGTFIARSGLVPVAGGIRLKSLIGSGDATCGLTATGSAVCWGNVPDSSGVVQARRVAVTTTGPEPFYTLAVATLGALFAAPAPGTAMCGLGASGAAYCWGDNTYGALGNGTTTTAGHVVRAAPGLVFTELAGGAGRFCGTTSDATIYCWGLHAILTNTQPTPSIDSLPVVSARGIALTSVAVGYAATCGVVGQSGGVDCWGEKGAMMGSGNTAAGFAPPHATPTPITSSERFSAVVVGTSEACAVTVGASLYCWGTNPNATAGNGVTNSALSPVLAERSKLTRIVSISDVQTCVLAVDGTPACWPIDQ